MLIVEGQVEIQAAGTTARLTAQGRELRLECADLPALLRAAGGPSAGKRDAPRAARGARSGSGDPLRLLRTVAARLAAVGLTLRISSGGRPLLILGRAARPGLAERLLRAPYLQLGSGREILRLLTR